MIEVRLGTGFDGGELQLLWGKAEEMTWRGRF